MASTSFDTLAAVRSLEVTGVDRKQAEAHANMLRQAATADRDDLVTKQDLADLRDVTRKDLTDLRDALRAELALIRRALGLLAAFVFAIGLRVFGVI